MDFLSGESFQLLWAQVRDNSGSVIAILLGASSTIVTAILGFRSRIINKSASEKERYFEDKNAVLKLTPTHRIGYSDRIAYILSELSMMAYIPFEQPNAGRKVLSDLLYEKLKSAHINRKSDLEKLVTEIDEDVFKYPNSSHLKSQLSKNDFELICTIDIGACQAFICRATEPVPYIVVSFRGSEQKKLDWLTNADALPFDEPEHKTHKVHGGFYRSLTQEIDVKGKTPIFLIKEAIRAIRTNEHRIPVYLTGHSLGGAWALLATRELKLNDPCACYSFGAPRVANYHYFYGMRHPVYRVVNSSDVVPRVPLGAIMGPFIWVMSLLQKIVRVVPVLSPLSGLFDKLISFLDRLKFYRHYGDLRYLTDTAGGNHKETNLLYNPPVFDRVTWFWRNMLSHWLLPIKSHSMAIYRNKLAKVAHDRLKEEKLRQVK